MKQPLIAFLGIIVSLNCFSQNLPENSGPEKQIYSVGGKNWGIGFGKGCARYDGLLLKVRNLNKETTLKTEGCVTNGIKLSVSNDANSIGTTNGINAGILFFDEHKVNGLALSTVWFALDKINGFAFSGISMNIDKQNGVGISGLIQLSYQINGLSFAGLDLTSKKVNGIALSGSVCLVDSVINGIEIAPVFSRAGTANGILIGLITKTNKTRGVQLGLINSAVSMQGIQVGLVNRIFDNPKWFRTIPLINFRFSRKTAEVNQ